MVDVQCLSDNELRKHLKKLGFAPGPIIPSTRKMYEKKLVQLLVSPPCELPVTKRLQKLHGPEDSDDNEDPAVNIVLKGNIKFSKDKVKECKKVCTNACAARPIPRSGHRCVTKEDFCQETQNPESSLLCQSPGNSFPWSLKLAILGIFIIVLFVYITIEKKPFLS
ncbi:Lemd1 [Phodopus roborovskii]|uniref:Lemd1 protein n=1 Tax=Phodopus roborovskii TaxID=109678 RepID=A0AAV0A352_PHORO|nr:Lemd1 [Phodopus roborovskii]